MVYIIISEETWPHMQDNFTIMVRGKAVHTTNLFCRVPSFQLRPATWAVVVYTVFAKRNTTPCLKLTNNILRFPILYLLVMRAGLNLLKYLCSSISLERDKSKSFGEYEGLAQHHHSLLIFNLNWFFFFRIPLRL